MSSTSPPVELPQRRRLASGLWCRMSVAVSVVVAIGLALIPFTAILVLGWLMRMMRRETAIALCRYSHPGMKRREAKDRLCLVDTLAPLACFPGWLRGMRDTVKSGLRATVAIAVATLPFGVILLLAWWAGWENSFNKGYEQSWVGPLVSLFGVVLAVFILIHLPMGLPHHAAEQRIGAVWELRVIRQLIAQVRWRYLALTLVAIALAVPLYLAQILPTFIENIYPKLATASVEEVRRFSGLWHLGFTAYLVLMLVILRRWAARLYARAIIHQGYPSFEFARKISDTLALPNFERQKAPGKLGELISTLLMAAGWLGFVAALYVAQFANHGWWNWLNQPMIALPWIYRPF